MHIDLIRFILPLFIVLFSVVIHEYAHGLLAYYSGDDTAYLLGRLTLNPLPHLDPIGSFFLPLALTVMGLPIIGYAKPVPINPFRFKNYDKGMILVSIAGCTANFLLGTIAALAARYVTGGIKAVFLYIATINYLLGFFNLLPIPPLDGSRIVRVFLPARLAQGYDRIERFGIIIIYLLLFSGLFGIVAKFAIMAVSKVSGGGSLY